MAPSQTISESREVPWRDSRGRANNLDFLRFLFAVLVIYSHSYVLILDESKGNYHEPFSVLTRGQMTGGGLAVAFFFIISGFLITQSWMNSRGLTDYLRRRVLRIYPGFIVVSLFCYLIVAPLGAAKPAAEVLAEFSLWRVLQYLVLLYLPSDPGVFVTNPLPYALNGSAWTIKYEFGCYVVVAFLGVAGLLRRRAWVLCLFAAWLTMFGLQISGHVGTRLPFENGKTWFLFGSFANYGAFLSYFLAGAVFYLFRDRIPYSRPLMIASVIGLALLCAAGKGLVLGTAVFGTYLVFCAGFHPAARFANFARRGDLSYGVYLYAFPIQQLLVHWFRDYLNPWTLFLTAVPLACAFAALSWFFVEKPALNFKKRSPLPSCRAPQRAPASW